jgi:O-antigen ligase
MEGEFRDRATQSVLRFKIYPGEALFLAAACTLFAIAPIYWLPGIGLNVIDLFKNVVFVFSGALAFLLARRIRVDKIFVLLMIVAAICNYMAFQINGSGKYATYQALIFLAPLFWVSAVYTLKTWQADILFKGLIFSFSIILIASVYVFLAGFDLVPDMRTPTAGLNFSALQAGLFRSLTVSSTGFNYGPTGWGVGAGMALTLLSSLLTSVGRRYLGLAVLMFAVLAFATMGARGATLGALSAFIVAVAAFQSLRFVRFLLMGTAVAIAVLAREYLAEINVLSERFFVSNSNAGLFYVIDQITTGRLWTWVNALERFAQSPIIGVGVEQSLVIRNTGEIVEVHNRWLRFLSEGGLLSFIPAVAAFIYCSVNIWRVRELRPLLSFVLVVSMLEPMIVFGTFGNQLPFWTALAYALRARDHI